MLNHERGFLRNGKLITFHKIAQLLLRLVLVEHRVVLCGFYEFIIAVNWSIVLQNIKNKTLLNSLLHSVDMEWPMLDFIVFWVWNTEHFKGFVLGCGCKGNIAGVCQHSFALDAFLNQAVDAVFIVLFICSGTFAGQHDVHFCRHTAALR